MRLIALFALSAFSLGAFAATINVTSPESNDFLGRNNTVRFNITNANSRVEVVVTAISNDDPSVRITQRQEFNPPANGTINGTITLNFPENQPNGEYRIQIQTLSSDPYNTVPQIPVTVDTIAPKILSFNPVQNTFFRDIVHIAAEIEEENIDEWRVTVNGNNIPGNIGNIRNISLTWDASGLTTDGQQTIAIRIEDKAGNETSQNIPITIDRLPPSSAILAPLSVQTYRPGARIPVVVEIADQFSNAVDERNVDVTIETSTGEFLSRVALISASNQGNNLVWTGRIRDTSRVPSTFVIRVTARDKAGNQAADQTVTINTTRSISDLITDPDEEEKGSGAVRDAARMAYTRGGMHPATARLFNRTPRQIFGRAYGSGN